MGLVVQKYGGSSVADAEKILSVARRVIETGKGGKSGKGGKGGIDVVVVVSAMGDTTDDLIELATSVSRDPNPRELDLLLSTGELVSCTLLTMALRDLGQDAISLSGPQAGILTDTSHGRARIHRVDTGRVRHELTQGRTVVVAGFQGITEGDDITTLGRGGSDTTAVALAAALGADRCEIYTDVEGIYTADPRVAPPGPETGRDRVRGDAGTGQSRRQDASPVHRVGRGLQGAHFRGVELQQRSGHPDPRRLRHGGQAAGAYFTAAWTIDFTIGWPGE